MISPKQNYLGRQLRWRLLMILSGSLICIVFNREVSWLNNQSAYGFPPLIRTNLLSST
jgi:hypothetical protein